MPVRSSRKPLVAEPQHDFSEADAWTTVGDGWKHLHGSFQDLGFSIEWHDFTPSADLDWSQSFHPGSLEICLNLSGNGFVKVGGKQLDLTPNTAGFYLQNNRKLTGSRKGGERHRFITVELSPEFLRRYLIPNEAGLHKHLKGLLDTKPTAQVSDPIRLTSDYQQIVMSLQRPPVYAAAQRMWYHSKALEIAAAFLYQPSGDESLFCQRQKRQNQERVQKVIALLKNNLSETPSLEEIGKQVGCSHFYLSRIFTQEVGHSIFQHLRELRMEQAAELLLEGRLNVTQVALEVGYSSPSHFSLAFHEAFGSCPGLYRISKIGKSKAAG